MFPDFIENGAKKYNTKATADLVQGFCHEKLLVDKDKISQKILGSLRLLTYLAEFVFAQMVLI